MIQELKDFFNSITLPEGTIYLHPSTKINDIRFFLKSHFKALENDPYSKVNAPIIDRLKKLKEILEIDNSVIEIGE